MYVKPKDLPFPVVNADPSWHFRPVTAWSPSDISGVLSVNATSVHDALPEGFTASADLVFQRLGGGFCRGEDPRFPGKALQLRLTATSVASGATVAAGWYNRTGATVAAGKYIVAVAA